MTKAERRAEQAVVRAAMRRWRWQLKYGNYNPRHDTLECNENDACARLSAQRRKK